MNNKKYSELEESAKDDRFCAFFILPVIVILIIFASIWTYSNWLNAL
jgi:hypothetical protein